jgi:hypothetical protein
MGSPPGEYTASVERPGIADAIQVAHSQTDTLDKTPSVTFLLDLRRLPVGNYVLVLQPRESGLIFQIPVALK